MIGFIPTDITKWACADKIWVDNIEPSDHNMIWWDRNDNTLKIYGTTSWIPQTLNGKVATGTLLTNAKINLVDAINELKNRIDNLSFTASNISVIDSGNLFANVNVEGCLYEAMTKANSAFQSASDGKINIANAITGKGVIASNTDTFPVLASKIGQIPIGKQFKSGEIKNYTVGSTFTLTLPFTPSTVVFTCSQFNTNFVDGIVQNRWCFWLNGSNFAVYDFTVTPSGSIIISGNKVTAHLNYSYISVADLVTWIAYE